MLLWPAHSHTSPNTTAASEIRGPPLLDVALMLRPAKLAGVGGSRASQVCCPSHVSRVAAMSLPPKCTVTSAAAGANPQTTELSGADWSTMPSPRIEAKRKLGLPASSLLNPFSRDRASTDSISRSRPLGARPPTTSAQGWPLGGSMAPRGVSRYLSSQK